MPLDNFQKRVARLISPNRTPSSPFAGGAMIHKNGFRLSDDGDIFTDSQDVDALFKEDLKLLISDGLHVEETKRYPGFVEAIVSSQSETDPGVTKLQWVREGLRGFFTPIPDPELGYRLHFADLAVNKLLACVGRSEARDYVDLWMIDQLVMPLWRLANAAPGKDIRWSPISILEKLSATMVFTEEDFGNDVLSMIHLDPAVIIQDLMVSLEHARGVLRDLPFERMGKLEHVDGEVVSSPENEGHGEWIAPKKGGLLLTPENGDDWLTRKIVEKFGIDGANITDSLTFP
jgi:hypothetical protein